MLRSLYVNLLDQIESHTLAVLPGSEQPLPDYITSRHALHVAIVDALENREHDAALSLIAQHNTSHPLPAPVAPTGSAAARS
jgi:DNA-binding FadR family transcriptional regulator